MSTPTSIVDFCTLNVQCKSVSNFHITIAARNGHRKVVETLVRQFGADVSIADAEGCTALHWLASNGTVDVFYCLRKCSIAVTRLLLKLVESEHLCECCWFLTSGGLLRGKLQDVWGCWNSCSVWVRPSTLKITTDRPRCTLHVVEDTHIV